MNSASLPPSSFRARLGAAIQRIRSWTSWVWDRITHEPGYAQTLAALALALAESLCRDQAARGVVRWAARALLVLARTFASDEGSHAHDRTH